MKYANKKTLLLAGLLALIASSAFGSSYWRFINMTVGQPYGVTAQRQFPAALVVVEDLYAGPGLPLNAGNAEFIRVDPSVIAGGDAPELLINNSVVHVFPTDTPDYVQFRWGTTGGNLFNLTVNGSRRQFASEICEFHDKYLGRKALGRVHVQVLPDDETCQSGFLTMRAETGFIDDWRFGGQVTRIDDVLMTP